MLLVGVVITATAAGAFAATTDDAPYRAGEPLWVKTKNRATARFAEKRERVARGRATATPRA